MKKIFLIVGLMCGILLAQAQEKLEVVPVSPEKYAAEIDLDDMRYLLTVLSSDQFEGRETGTPGQVKAARFIANKFRSYGLPRLEIDGKKTYYQNILFSSETWDSIAISVGTADYRHLRDFYAFPTKNENLPAKTITEMTFVGYGIEAAKYNDYKKVDVEGKTLLMYAGEPTDAAGNSLLTGTKTPSDWTTDVDKRLQVAKQKGAAFVFVIDPKLKENIAENRRLLLGRGMRIGGSGVDLSTYPNHAFISSTMAKQMIGDKAKKMIKARDKAKKKGGVKPVTIATNIALSQKKATKKLEGSNVLGYIEGVDPQMKDEVVILTAHYDHLGKRGKSIYNGADDNGSGTTTALEIAQAFAAAKKAGDGPRRSVLVMLVSGEEKGLLGSKYYTQFPVFDLEKTVANVNVDMVGRVDEKYQDNPNYIYVIGADRLSTELHDINEAANEKYTQLELDYTYNAEDDPNRFYYRSDHYNFAKHNIPAVFYFNGTHKDYHLISDTVEKINFEKMQKIGQLVFHTVWELANRDKRIEVNVPQKK
ncbi:MAG: M28 family peptidase [Bacteroidota bacterium]